MNEEPQARHWQMLGYTTVKMPDGSRYDFLGTDTRSLEEHAKDHRGRIFREQRRLDAVMLFLDGKTTQDLDAIR